MVKQTSMRLPNETASQIARLAPRYGNNRTTVMVVAIDRLYNQVLDSSLRDAAAAALRNFRRWRGAAIVRMEDGVYDAIPVAYLADASYGDRDSVEVLFKLLDESQLGEEWDGTVTEDTISWFTDLLRDAQPQGKKGEG